MTSNRTLRRTSTIVAAAALAALALTACTNSQKASTQTTTATSPAAATPSAEEATPAAGANSGIALSGKTFTSTEITGHALVPDSSLTMAFEDDSVSVQAGCNNMFGGYTFDQLTLDVPLLASTMMACEPALMEQDQWITGFLASSPKATLADKSLTLISGDTTIVLNQD